METISSRKLIYRVSAVWSFSLHLDAADASSPATVPTLISRIRIIADGIKAQNSSNAVANEIHLRKQKEFLGGDVAWVLFFKKAPQHCRGVAVSLYTRVSGFHTLGPIAAENVEPLSPTSFYLQTYAQCQEYLSQGLFWPAGSSAKWVKILPAACSQIPARNAQITRQLVSQRL